MCVFGPSESVSVASCCSLESPVDGQTALAGTLCRVFASSCLGGCSEPPGGGLRGQALQATGDPVEMGQHPVS